VHSEDPKQGTSLLLTREHDNKPELIYIQYNDFDLSNFLLMFWHTTVLFLVQLVRIYDTDHPRLNREYRLDVDRRR
jgi:hypothetical protein